MRKRVVLFGAILVVITLLLTGCDPDPLTTGFMHAVSDKTVSYMTVARIYEIVDGESVRYANICRVEDFETCTDEICELDVTTVISYKSENNNPRVGVPLFRIVYKCGCSEFIDARGRILFCCADDAERLGKEKIFRSMDLVLDTKQFNALVQKYLPADE